MENQMSLRSDYDVWHDRIDRSDPEHDDATSPWYLLVREYLGDVSGLKILEVACGLGGFVRAMTRAGAKVTGCDFSLRALQVARRKLAGGEQIQAATVTQADAQNLPFASETFDLVVSCETIEHLPDDQKALAEMFRVTRPGGKLFLTTPNYLNLIGLYDVYAKVRHPNKVDDQPFDRRQWFVQVKHKIRSAGWSILRTDGTVHQFPVIPGRNPLRWRSLESSPGIRKLLSPISLHYFVMAQKKRSEGEQVM
jgi:SAM-dependent methyltransferase